mgnify:CR=1 FL=1
MLAHELSHVRNEDLRLLGLADIVSEGLSSGRLTFEVGAAAAATDTDIVFLCVPTPQGADA